MTMAAELTEVPKPTLSKKPFAPVCTRVAPNMPLTCFDRCDCSAVAGDQNGRPHLGFCSAQALVRVTLMTGGQILFCGHHYAKHGPKITRVAVVHNECEQGEVAPSASTTLSRETPLVSAQ
jgi:hypothetical protein